MAIRRTVTTILLFTFALMSAQPVGAQRAPLPPPGAAVALTAAFTPALLRGVKVDAANPFRFAFLLDHGRAPAGSKDPRETMRLLNYFVAALTVPEKDLWVNLSPYEKGRIIAPAFGATGMGRDLLAQDYLLKQQALQDMIDMDTGNQQAALGNARAADLGGATRALEERADLGGIDLRAFNAAIEVQGRGPAFTLRMDPAQLREYENADGFVPVIVGERAFTSLTQFLGVK